jgi:regulatory protein
MKTVVKIERFKGKRGYKRVIFNDSSQLQVDDELISYFGIKDGAEFDDNQLKNIKELSARKITKDKALEFLKYGGKSERELIKKLAGLRLKQEIINETIQDLKRVGFVNDEEFALRFSRNFITRKPAGEFLIKTELKKRGIKDEVIEETIKKIYSEFDKKELALKLVRKKKFNLPTDNPKEKKKISDLLLRRGFDWGIVGEVMKINSE